MGQYYLPVNVDRREFLDPHKFGDGLKLMEQFQSTGGVIVALGLLLAPSNGRGGGDLRCDQEVNDKWAGRWAGDRVYMAGDYEDHSDMAKVYDLLGVETNMYDHATKHFTDISYDILADLMKTGELRKTDEFRDTIARSHSRPDMVIGLQKGDVDERS